MTVAKDPTNNLVIREYRDHDMTDVIHVWHQCGLVVPNNDPKQDIERKLEVNPEWFLVGVLNEKPIATCMAGYEGHRGWINYLAVLPSYQRCGIATHMMKEAEKRLIAANCPKINLQIRRVNIGVRKFYEHLGYADDDVISMGKRL